MKLIYPTSLFIFSTVLPCAAQTVQNFDVNGPRMGGITGSGAGFGFAGDATYSWSNNVWVTDGTGNSSGGPWQQDGIASFFSENTANQIYRVNTGMVLREISGLDVKNGSLSIFGTNGLLLSGASGTTLNVENDAAGTARVVSLNIIVSGTTSNTPTLRKTGTGTLAFSEANTFNIPFSIEAGTVRLDADHTLASNFVLTTKPSGTLDLNGHDQSLLSLGDVSLGGSTQGTIDLGSGTLSVERGFADEVISGTGGLVKNGAPGVSLNMTEDNPFTGPVVVNGGVVSFGNTTPRGSVVGDISLVGSSAALKFSHTTNRTFAQKITGGGMAIHKVEANTLTLTGQNTATAPIFVTGGTLQIGSGGTTGSISSSSVDLEPAASLIFNRSNSSSYSGTITGGGTVTKQGSGTLDLGNILSGATSTHNGTFNVIGGSLNFYGIIASNMNIDGSSTFLRGTGTITGNMTLRNGARVSPDYTLSSSTLTVRNLSTVVGGTSASSLLLNFASNSGSLIINKLKVTGDLNLTGLSLGTSNNTGIAIPHGSVYTIIEKTSSGPITSTFSAIPEGRFLTAANGQLLRVSYVGGDGNDVTLTAYNASELQPTITNFVFSPSTAGDPNSAIQLNFTVFYLPNLSNKLRLETSTDLINWTLFPSATNPATFSTNASGLGFSIINIAGTSQASTPKLFVRMVFTP